MALERRHACSSVGVRFFVGRSLGLDSESRSRSRSRSKVKVEGQRSRSKVKVKVRVRRSGSRPGLTSGSRSRLQHRLRTHKVWRSLVYDSATLLFTHKVRVSYRLDGLDQHLWPLAKQRSSIRFVWNFNQLLLGSRGRPWIFFRIFPWILFEKMDQRSAGRPSNISGTWGDRKSSEGLKCVDYRD